MRVVEVGGSGWKWVEVGRSEWKWEEVGVTRGKRKRAKVGRKRVEADRCRKWAEAGGGRQN